MSGASERANGRASGPVLMSGFLVDLAHSALAEGFSFGGEHPGAKPGSFVTSNHIFSISEWPSTHVPIVGCSAPPWGEGGAHLKSARFRHSESPNVYMYGRKDERRNEPVGGQKKKQWE